MFFYDTEIRVRYQETDQMRIVHHSNYYVWFELGRSEFMRAAGLTYSEVEKKGYYFPLIETHCIYKQGARYDELLRVRTYITEYKGIHVTFEYDIYRVEDGSHLAHGKTIHTFVNKEMKPVNIRKHNPEIYELMIHCMQQDTDEEKVT